MIGIGLRRARSRPSAHSSRRRPPGERSGARPRRRQKREQSEIQELALAVVMAMPEAGVQSLHHVHPPRLVGRLSLAWLPPSSRGQARAFQGSLDLRPPAALRARTRRADVWRPRYEQARDWIRRFRRASSSPHHPKRARDECGRASARLLSRSVESGRMLNSASNSALQVSWMM